MNSQLAHELIKKREKYSGIVKDIVWKNEFAYTVINHSFLGSVYIFQDELYFWTAQNSIDDIMGQEISFCLTSYRESENGPEDWFYFFGSYDQAVVDMTPEKAAEYICKRTVFYAKPLQFFDFGIVLMEKRLGRVFLPRAESCILGEETPTTLYKDRLIPFILIKYNEERNTFIGSCREVVKRNISTLPLTDINDLYVGKKMTGVVESIGQYVVFVNLGGLFGGIHISQLINKNISVGMFVNVRIESIDNARERIVLSEISQVNDTTQDNKGPTNNIQNLIDVGDSQANSCADKSESGIDELNQLIGLDSIKQDVKSLVNMVKMQKIREQRGLKTIPLSLHLVFTGNPGTGKTTVARILAQIYKEIGVLKTGQLVEVDRSGLVAGYVGQTALKTQEKIKEAIGGILFIDEAYTLARDGNDYGQEAIDTILKAMEDHRGEFIVIVAGYEEPMMKFINSNPGLKSRFNKFFDFPDYSSTELKMIFDVLCKAYDYTITDEAHRIVAEHINQMVREKSEDFANARDIRNYFESIITKQANRVALINTASDSEVLTIESEDVLF